MNTPYQSADRRPGSMLMATLLAAASTISLAAPPRLVGQSIGNDEAIEAAFKEAVNARPRRAIPFDIKVC